MRISSIFDSRGLVSLVRTATVSLSLVFTEAAQADDISAVHGQVLTQSNQPVPGCSVYLASQHIRTEPAITTIDGTFTLPVGSRAAVEINNGNAYLEIYWGKDVLYRQLFDPVEGLNRSSVLELPPILLGKPRTNPASAGAVYYGRLTSNGWTDVGFNPTPGGSDRPTIGEHLTANIKLNVRADYITFSDTGIQYPPVTGVLEPQARIVVTDVKTIHQQDGTHYLIKMRAEN
jgi:hypothetical protein